jgi:hypothetical protein
MVCEDLATFLLKTLIVPAVEEIAIFVADEFDGPMPLTRLLTSMISRSTNVCVLQRLSLGESSYLPGELIALFRLTPCLVFLNIKFPPLDDHVHLGVIDSMGGPSPTVPLLHSRGNKCRGNKDSSLIRPPNMATPGHPRVQGPPPLGYGCGTGQYLVSYSDMRV